MNNNIIKLTIYQWNKKSIVWNNISKDSVEQCFMILLLK